MKEQTNYVFLQGEVVNQPTITYTRDDENFYAIDIKIDRQSDKYDVLRVIASERLYDKVSTEKFITVFGELRTRNYKDDSERSHLSVYVFAKDLQFNLEKKHENEIELVGYICKPPIFRITPFKREICDLLIAVNRPNKKRSDYIPSIAWGRNATFTGELEVGTCVCARGRFQSREYQKVVNDEQKVFKAYEFSIGSIVKIEENLEENNANN